MSSQTKGMYELTNKPWTLPADRMRHLGCNWINNWVRLNSNFLLKSGYPCFFIEEYDPYRTLSLICEWYDYCRKYDESKRHGIKYRIQYYTRFVDEKYNNHVENYPNFHRSQDNKLIKELYDKLKETHPNKIFTVTLREDLKYIVHMIDNIPPSFNRFKDRDVLYQKI